MRTTGGLLGTCGFDERNKTYRCLWNNNKILLIDKVGGPYNGKLDLPGGTIEFYENPEETLIRELYEEIGINVTKYELVDVNSINLEWKHKGETEKIKHIFILYKIIEFNGNIKEKNIIDDINDDSKGAKFYDIRTLDKSRLSDIALKALERIL